MEMALKAVTLSKHWYVVVDPGCGATHNIAPAMLKQWVAKSLLLTLNQTGIFQHENLSRPLNHSKIWQTLSKTLGADAGIAF